MGATTKPSSSSAGGGDWASNLANAGFGIAQTIAQGYADKASGKYKSGGTSQAMPGANAQFTPTIITVPSQVASTVPAPAAAPAISPQMMLIAGVALVLVVVLMKS